MAAPYLPPRTEVQYSGSDSQNWHCTTAVGGSLPDFSESGSLPAMAAVSRKSFLGVTAISRADILVSNQQEASRLVQQSCYYKGVKTLIQTS